MNQFRFIKDRNYIWTKSDVNQKWFDTTYAGTASGFSISGFSAGAIIRTGDTPSISDITEYYRGPAERVEVAISKRMEVAATLPDATYLPEGYPAYCIYIAMGLNPEPEAKVLAKLKEWGNTMGSNLLVAPWNIGDISYRELVKKLEINQVPSLILTDDNNPDKNSLLIKIDDPADVNNVERLVEILPPLVNHILAGNSKRLLKEAIGFRQNSKVKSYLKPIASTLKRIKKLKIAADGFEIELS